METHDTCPETLAEPNDLEVFLAQMLNTSAEVGGDYAAQVGAGLRRGAPADEGPRERALTPEEEQLVVERRAIERVWADIRAASAVGHLVTPSRWEEIAVVPAHMGADEFAVMVFDALEACAEGRAFEGSGIPVAEEEPEEQPSEEEPAAEADAQPAIEADAPQTAEAEPEEPRAEEELLAEPKVLEEVRAPLTCDDIVVIEGRKDTYLYARDAMSENYAHWAYLAAEDDDRATFVDNVRQESRVYPRPMLATAFRNPPYRWTRERTESVFQEVSASGDYPDIARVVATNGDVYFYSTDFLSPAQARALAQWYSVEKPMNV